MKKLIVYNSDTGFTKKYAEWIAAELDCEAVPIKEYLGGVQTCDVLIYGGSLLASKIKGLDKIKKKPNFRQLVVYATGATPQSAEQVISNVQKNNFSESEMTEIPFYYFEGGIDYENMNFIPRKVLQTIYKSLKKKTERTDEETGMMEAIRQSKDMTRKEYIDPLVNYINNEIFK